MLDKKKYQSLILPTVEWKSETLKQTFGECVAAPLEPGFGVTLGNALRRILLGGVEGSAVASVIINGVNNEFSTIHGVVEDVLTILLDIKKLIIKNSTGLPGEMKIHVKGKSVVTAKDIISDSHLEVLNKDLVIANLSDDAELKISFFVESGRGYKLAEWPIDKGLQEDGRIYLDTTFSPVRQVSFDVEKTRIGKEIDYDKLILSITTDGTETPQDVLHYAVSVLQSQFSVFLSGNQIEFSTYHSSKQKFKGSEISHEITSQKAADGKSLLINGISADLFFKSISALGLPVRVQNSLFSADIERVIDLVNMSENDIISIKNFGKKSYEDLLQIMKEFGLSFNMKIKEKNVIELVENYETSN